MSNTANIKDLHYNTNTSLDNDTMTHPNEEVDNGPNIIQQYTLKLPSIRYTMKPAEETQESKEERIVRKGKYALAVLNSPTGSSNHKREKEYQHSSKEHGKTLYGSCDIVEGDDSFSSLDLLQIMIKHVEQNKIEAFYKTVDSRFIVVLYNFELKGTFPPEFNFQEKIHSSTVNFRLRHETQKRKF